MHSGTKPLSEPLLTKIAGALLHKYGTTSWYDKINSLMQNEM